MRPGRVKLIRAVLIIPCKIAEAVGIFDRWAATKNPALPDAYTGVTAIQNDGRFGTTGLRLDNKNT
jgi:hypothetical protein